MGSICVVVLPPIADDDACCAQIQQPFSPETFVVESTVKTLDITVLPGTAWIDIDCLDVVIAMSSGRFRESSATTTEVGRV